MIETDPTIEANFHRVLEDHTAGDPMRLDVKWTNLSRRQIAARIGLPPISWSSRYGSP